jgi:hypothetical protein
MKQMYGPITKETHRVSSNRNGNSVSNEVTKYTAFVASGNEEGVSEGRHSNMRKPASVCSINTT